MTWRRMTWRRLRGTRGVAATRPTDYLRGTRGVAATRPADYLRFEFGPAAGASAKQCCPPVAAPSRPPRDAKNSAKAGQATLRPVEASLAVPDTCACARIRTTTRIACGTERRGLPQGPLGRNRNRNGNSARSSRVTDARDKIYSLTRPGRHPVGGRPPPRRARGPRSATPRRPRAAPSRAARRDRRRPVAGGSRAARAR